jgi:glycosyltransferase involved in cell wall biosynthesis
VKVLHLLASPVFSGPAELVVQLALAQRSLGHQVSIAVDRKRTDHSSEELAAPRLAALGLLDEGGLELSVKSGPRALWRDTARLRAREVDVVHCHFSHDHFLARLARPKRAVLIRSVHAPRSLRWSTPSAAGWTVPLESFARSLLGRPVVVLPALVDAAFVPGDRAATRLALGLPTGRLIGMVSTFQASRRHWLGLDAFVQVARRQVDAQLVLVGDGALGAALRARVEALALVGRVHFVGYQSGAAFVAHVQALEEVWLLGLGNDFSGRAAAQARACGVRVVAVDEGALARHADHLVACEPNELAAAALTGQRRAVAVETPQAVATRVLELYAAAARAGLP